MYNSLTLQPAYGRDYKSKAQVMADWDTGKDFLATGFNGEGYVNNAQLLQLAVQGITHLHFRYAKLTKVHVLPLTR